jgi:hypothetical protein
MNILKNTLLFLVSMVVVIVCCEFFARLYFSDITSTPNMQTWFGQRWIKENVVKNSLGFREREISPIKASGAIRIAVIGDSFSFGQGIPVEDRFSNRMEEALNQTGTGFEVLNFSLPGRTTRHELRTLEEVVLPLDPDFILVQWLPNDFETPADAFRAPQARLISNLALHKKALRNSALYYLLSNQWFKLRPLLGLDNFDYTEKLMAPFADGDSSVFSETIRPMAELLAELNAGGKGYAVVLHPFLLPGMGENYVMQPMHDAVLVECERSQAQCLDLAPAFIAYGPDFDFTSLWVNRFDQHPGSEANGLVADEVLKALGDELRSPAYD